MNQRNDNIEHSQEGLTEGWLFFVVESLVIVAAYVITLRGDPRLREPLRLALLTTLILAHVVLLWLSAGLFQKQPRILPIYFFVQVLLAFVVSLLTPGSWLAIALYMGLTGMAIAVLWPNGRAVAAAVLLCIVLSTYHLVTYWGWQDLVQFLPSLGIALSFVVVYVALFTRQMQARERAQNLLYELENAHRQLRAYADRVEELTIGQERQRMAQELHDTLAQGLAGLILQLEAADSHLEEDNAPQAQETVQRAMARARTTLHEARRAIHALRPTALEHNSLVDALGHEVDEFAATTGIQATFQVDAGSLDVPLAAAQDILRIVQESLTNIARHAHAAHVLVRLEAGNDRLRVVVQDDGSGFDPKQVVGQPDAYGLRGMQERAGHLGGELAVRSEPGRGTTVTLEMEMPYDPRVDRR
ncbi:MAG: sensor histidine kinase [Anaerolineae bacterium]|nr:sensor histidine kinase [Anaerolineae bacterium]